jgi:Undecaprenyl-phosphate galactose phosphotransferase WbaP
VSDPAPQPDLRVLTPGESTPGRIQRLNSTLVLTARWLLNTAVMLVAEWTGLFLALYLASSLRTWLRDTTPFPEWWWFLGGVWTVVAVGIRLVPGWGLGAVEELRRTVLLLTGVFAFTTTALFLGKTSTDYSRLTLSLAYLFSVFLLPAIRMQVKGLLIRTGWWGMPTLLCGDDDSLRRVIQALREEQGLGYIPVAVFDEDQPRTEGELMGLPRVRHPSEAIADVVIVARPEASRHRLVETVEGSLSTFRHVVVIPDLVEAPSLWVKPRDLGGVLGLEISSNLLDGWARLIKRITDLLLVLATLPLWLPVLLCIALAIWVQDRKSPIFRQERVGQHGRKFRMIKFRTMHTNAEELLQARLEEDAALRAEWAKNFKLRRDPRITPVGRFLRVTSLDELPQLLNVLRNDMSLVGPRPLPDYHRDELPPRLLSMRERVKPGLTGLWQVSGRSESGNNGIIKWDAYYVRNWSVWLDIVILVRTLRVVLTGRGAY